MAAPKVRLCPHCGNPIPADRRNHCSIECQLWSQIDVRGPDECWLWTGAKNQGYGTMKVGGRQGEYIRPHRLAWELTNGKKMAVGIFACHRCDVRACCNPNHIFEGSAMDNTQDMMSKGRHRINPPKGESHGFAKLSDDDVIKIMSDDRPQRVLAREYGVSQHAIHAVKANKTWKHVDVQCPVPQTDKSRKAYHRSHLSPLTEDQVRAIRADPRSTRAIAKDYGIAGQNVWMIKARKTWKHLTP